jgi:hypothetical protein
MKNPTHVDVHNVQLIRSPKNLELRLTQFLVLSNIEPHTKIEVNPYAVKIHKINSIKKFLLLNDKQKKV